MYSPRIPIKKICTDPRKNTPITTGAYPAGSADQNNSFKIKYKIAMHSETAAMANPAKVVTRRGTFEWDVIPSIAMS